MNYKKIIRSRKTRIFLLSLLSFIPDKAMLKLQYRIKFGRGLNLKNPQRFTEKIQWYKLYYRDPLMAQCVDKYEVRKYVEQMGFGDLLNELYGVYDHVDDIDFDALPEKFVLKGTLGGGGNQVYICTDKARLDIEALKISLCQWLKPKKKEAGREWIYRGKPRIVAEKYIEAADGELGIIDFKFYCYFGKAKILLVWGDRKLGEDGAVAHYSIDYEKLPYFRTDERRLTADIAKPANYGEMVSVAEKLAEPFPYVRVDLYNEGGKIVFGELTFFEASGYCSFEPDEFDYILGNYFELPEGYNSKRRR